ncbi:MAG: hypothetical protein ABJC67_18450 [Lentilitoribacter sp.]
MRTERTCAGAAIVDTVSIRSCSPITAALRPRLPEQSFKNGLDAEIDTARSQPALQSSETSACQKSSELMDLHQHH